jgi:hypothetical protein
VGSPVDRCFEFFFIVLSTLCHLGVMSKDPSRNA